MRSSCYEKWLLESPNLRKAILKNELTTCYFLEATLKMFEALDRRKAGEADSISCDFSEALAHVFALVSFAVENQKILQHKGQMIRF